MTSFNDIWHDPLIVSKALKNAAEARAWLSRHERHYVYILARSCGEPFYVGKGYGLRALQHEADARGSTVRTHKLNVIRKLRSSEGLCYALLEADSHACALKLEMDLIERIGRAHKGSGPLTNQTAGGEGTLDPSEESLERRRGTLAGEGEDEVRNSINRWFARLSQVGSVPVKPVETRYRIDGLWRNRDTFAVSERQAAALTGALIATNTELKTGAVIPRRFRVENDEVIIENGVGRDLLSSGMAELVDGTKGYETLRITTLGVTAICNLIDAQLLVSSGLTEP